MSSDAASAFLCHSNTPSSSVHLPHWWGQQTGRGENQSEGLWDFPSAPHAQHSAISFFSLPHGLEGVTFFIYSLRILLRSSTKEKNVHLFACVQVYKDVRKGTDKEVRADLWRSKAAVR